MMVSIFSKFITALFLVVIFFHSQVLFAQDKGDETSHAVEYKNSFAVFVGNTMILPSGFNLQTIGFEYVHEYSHLFGFGLIGEAELGSYIIQKNETNHIVASVSRDRAFLVLPNVFINIYKGLIVSAGYGVEFEKNEDLGLLKIGIEYQLYLQNPRWVILPTISWDHTRIFDGFVYGVNFGYKF